MTSPLPTDAQLRRRALADALVTGCPDYLNMTAITEIALTGSTASGLADDTSDLEITIWTTDALRGTDLIAWLAGAGVGELGVEPAPRDDDSRWVYGVLAGVPLEVGNQTYDELAHTVMLLTTDPYLPPRWVALAALLTSAMPLRTSGQLARLTEPLRTYPAALRERLMTDALTAWQQRTDELERLLLRGEWIALSERIAAACNGALRFLYARDRRWQPGPKWTLTGAATLPTAPAGLSDRVAAFTTARTLDDLRAGDELLAAIFNG